VSCVDGVITQAGQEGRFAAPDAGAGRRDPVMNSAASTAPHPNAAAQIQLIWVKLDWNRAGSE
jgi:hypothetical protein